MQLSTNRWNDRRLTARARVCFRKSVDLLCTRWNWGSCWNARRTPNTNPPLSPTGIHTRVEIRDRIYACLAEGWKLDEKVEPTLCPHQAIFSNPPFFTPWAQGCFFRIKSAGKRTNSAWILRLQILPVWFCHWFYFPLSPVESYTLSFWRKSPNRINFHCIVLMHCQWTLAVYLWQLLICHSFNVVPC